MRDKRHSYTLRLELPQWERLRKLSYERNESIQSFLDDFIKSGIDSLEKRDEKSSR